jgi:hypothetical protein
MKAVIADVGTWQAAAFATSRFRAEGERAMALLLSDYRTLTARYRTVSLMELLRPSDWQRLRELARQAANPLAPDRHKLTPLPEAVRDLLQRRASGN